MIMNHLLLKNIFPKSIKRFIRYSLFPFNGSIPYKYDEPTFANFNVSDFFLFRCDNFETEFIAENNLALVLAKPILCNHKFYFFNKVGKKCGFFEVEDDGFHITLKINKEIVGGEEIGSFFHQTDYPNSDVNKLISEDTTPLFFQHRGYSGFRRQASKTPLSSFVHGNFGAMYLDNNKVKSLAVQRKKHFYTPQVIINPKKSYDFFFNNPTHKNLSVRIILSTKTNKFVMEREIVINPLGIYKFNLDNCSRLEELNISWETRLPIGRATIFEYQKSSFDVFHS